MGKTDQQQNKYDALLLKTVEGIDRKTDKLDNKVDDLSNQVTVQGVELKANTDETRLLKTEVRETNGSVKTLQGEVVEIKKVVFPDAPMKPSDLPQWWRNPKIIAIVSYIALAFLLLVAAVTKFDLSGIL